MNMGSKCQHCASTRLLSVTAKCSDLFTCVIKLGEMLKSYTGPVPGDLNIGSDDYLKFSFCLDCGRIQGEFPLLKSSTETTDLS